MHCFRRTALAALTVSSASALQLGVARTAWSRSNGALLRGGAQQMSGLATYPVNPEIALTSATIEASTAAATAWGGGASLVADHFTGADWTGAADARSRWECAQRAVWRFNRSEKVFALVGSARAHLAAAGALAPYAADALVIVDDEWPLDLASSAGGVARPTHSSSSSELSSRKTPLLLSASELRFCGLGRIIRRSLGPSSVAPDAVRDSSSSDGSPTRPASPESCRRR